MIKPCIICGSPALVETESEIVSCENEHCMMVIENSIGLHYAVGNSVIGCDTARPGGDVSATVTYQGGEIININNGL